MFWNLQSYSETPYLTGFLVIIRRVGGDDILRPKRYVTHEYRSFRRKISDFKSED